MSARRRLLFLVSEDWYFYSHRMPIARAALAEGLDVAVATRIGEHRHAIESLGIRVFPLTWKRRRISFLEVVRATRQIVAVHRAFRPDVVHHVSLKPILLGSAATVINQATSTVNAVTGLGSTMLPQTFGARIRARVVMRMLAMALRRRGSHAIVQNVDDLRFLSSLGVPDELVSLIPGSGVDTELFCPVPEPPGPICVTMVSRMLRDKGVAEFVEAARIVHRKHDNVRFQLVGAPDPENPSSIPEEQLRAWHREGVVSWIGYSGDIPAIWRKSHLAILPSYREGLPKSLLEAAASGRAIVTTDVPGCRELVQDGSTGVLVRPRSAVDLARGISELIADAGRRHRMGKAARDQVVSIYSERCIVRDTLALYRGILR